MKRTSLLSVFFSFVLVISMIASASALTASAQDVSEMNTTGGSAFGGERTTYVVTLYWDDNDNAYGTRPDEVTAVITANDGEFGSEYIYLNEGNHWENVKSGLPMFYFKGSRSGTISYNYEIFDLPDTYDLSVIQDGNWFKVTCTLSQKPTENKPYLIGDVDGDNDVGIIDGVLIQRYDVGYKPKYFNVEAGDVNNDHNVDIIDASIIQRYLAGFNCDRYGLI